VDGYANGWRAPASCRDVRFAFAPQRPVNWAYALSALACLLLLGFLVARRPGPETLRAAVPVVPADGPPERLALPRAAAIGAAVAIALAFLFAIRAGVALFPVVTFVLWRGIGARTLALVAAGLLAVEPAIYLLFTPEDRGGYNSNYPVALIGAHWVAVAAVVLLGLSLWRTLRDVRRRGPRADAPPEPVSARDRTPAGVA
jgi:FtsH-binding integral membrane protein